MFLGAKTFINMSSLLRIHPRIHNQWGKTALALDFLKHLCAKKPFVIANHLLIVGVCGMLLMASSISYVMTNQLRTRDRLGKKRRDLTRQRDSSFAASGPNGQLISTLWLSAERRVARYAYHISELAQRFATSLHLFQFDGLKTSQFQDWQSLRSHPNKGADAMFLPGCQLDPGY